MYPLCGNFSVATKFPFRHRLHYRRPTTEAEQWTPLFNDYLMICSTTCFYRVGQKEIHRDCRLVRLNGTCQIHDFLHKGSTEGGKTDASELGARQCEMSRKIRFVSRHAFWSHNCRKLGGDSCQTSSWDIGSWNLPLGLSCYRNGSTSFVIWWQWIKVSHQGKSDHQTTTIEQVAASVQQSPERSIWHRAQVRQ